MSSLPRLSICLICKLGHLKLCTIHIILQLVFFHMRYLGHLSTSVSKHYCDQKVQTPLQRKTRSFKCWYLLARVRILEEFHGFNTLALQTLTRKVLPDSELSSQATELLSNFYGKRLDINKQIDLFIYSQLVQLWSSEYLHHN